MFELPCIAAFAYVNIILVMLVLLDSEHIRGVWFHQVPHTLEHTGQVLASVPVYTKKVNSTKPVTSHWMYTVN